MGNRNKIIVALDGISEKKAMQLASALKRYVWGFKVNDLLFEDAGIIRKLKKFGRVFADAKLHDIPSTAANSASRLSVAGADMITVHASGGIRMMKAAKRSARRSKILAVTVLTSAKANSQKVKKLTRDALKAGVDGVVCSGRDLPSINRIAGSQSLLKIVPGIRPSWYKKKDDQKRTMTPQKAMELGADFLVIGRPVLDSGDPEKNVKAVFQNI